MSFFLLRLCLSSKSEGKPDVWVSKCNIVISACENSDKISETLLSRLIIPLSISCKIAVVVETTLLKEAKSYISVSSNFCLSGVNDLNP
jgi:hypothetical protein